MGRTRLLVAVALVAWMLAIPAGIGGAAVATPADATASADDATVDSLDGTVFQKTPCEYYDGDPDSDCTCDDMDDSPYCDDPLEP